MARYEWDENKNRKNKDKHNVRFENAVDAFEDPKQVTYQDTRHDYGEDRFVTIGAVPWWRKILMIVWTPRGDRKRVISARATNKKELEKYTNGFGTR